MTSPSPRRTGENGVLSQIPISASVNGGDEVEQQTPDIIIVTRADANIIIITTAGANFFTEAHADSYPDADAQTDVRYFTVTGSVTLPHGFLARPREGWGRSSPSDDRAAPSHVGRRAAETVGGAQQEPKA